jgi:hypothetical protein
MSTRTRTVRWQLRIAGLWQAAAASRDPALRYTACNCMHVALHPSRSGANPALLAGTEQAYTHTVTHKT